MKQVQVFKKTLLSVAVVTALGGYGTLSYGVETLQLEDTLFASEEQVPAEILTNIKTQFEGLDAASLKAAGLADVGKYEQEIAPLLATLNTAKGEYENAADDAAKTAKKSAYDAAVNAVKTKNDEFKKLLQALDKDTALDLFKFSGESAGGDATGSGSAKAPETKQKERLATVKTDWSKMGSPTAVSQSSLMAAQDDAAVKKLFTVGEGADAKAAEYVKLTGLNLTKTEGDDSADKVMEKLGKATAITTTDYKTDGLVVQGGRLELSGVTNKHETSVGNVKWVAKSGEGTAPADPNGTYIISDKSKLYHKSIGKGQAIENLSVKSGSDVYVEVPKGTTYPSSDGSNTVTVQNLQVKDAMLTGYYMEGTGDDAKKVQVPVMVSGAVPATPVLTKKQGDKNVPDKEYRANIISENGKLWIKTNKVAEISVTGGEVHSDQMGDKWDISGVAHGTLSLSLKDTRVTSDATHSDAQSTLPVTPVGSSGTYIAEAVNIENTPVHAAHKYTNVTIEGQKKKEVDREGLVTFKGANLERQIVEKQSDGTWKDTAKSEAVGDTFKASGDKSIIKADVLEFETIELSDGAQLIGNQVGTKDKPVDALKLSGKVALKQFSSGAASIYASNKQDLTLDKDQTIVHDIHGLKSFVLDGGTFAGNFYGTELPQSDKENKDQKEDPVKTSFELKGGQFQGGTVQDVQSVQITGTVHLKPTETDLDAFDVIDGKDVRQKRIAVEVDFKAPVTVASSGMPVIHKTLVKHDIDPAAKKGATVHTPVLAEQGMTLEEGGKIGLVMTGASPDVPYLSVTGGLTFKGNNRIKLIQGEGSSMSEYGYIRQLANQDPKTKPVSYAILTADTVEGEDKLLEPESAIPLLDVAVNADKTANAGYTYSITPTMAKNPLANYKAEGLGENHAQVAYAAEMSSVKADEAAGKRMYDAIQKVGHKEAAELNQWDPNNGAALAAVSVQQKTNQSISRHLNSSRTGIATGEMFESQGFWGEYMYSDGDMKDKDDVRGFKNKVSGITLGLDSLLNDQLTVGFAFTYGDVKTEYNDAGRDVNSNTYMGTLYTGWTQDNFFFDTMFSYGAGKNDYKRKADALGSYKAEGDSTLWSGRFVAGYNYLVNQWIIQPQVEFNYVNVKFDDFTEKGAGDFAQKVKHSDFEVMELGAGAKLMADFEMGNGVLKPEFTLMGYHDFKDKKAEVEGTFLAGGRHYVVSGSSRDQNRFLAGMGVSYAMDNNLSFGLNYDYNWLGDYKAHGLVASVRYDF